MLEVHVQRTIYTFPWDRATMLLVTEICRFRNVHQYILLNFRSKWGLLEKQYLL